MFFLIGENDGKLSIGQVKTPYSISEIMSIDYEGVNTCPEDVYDEGLDFWNYYYIDMFDGEKIVVALDYIFLHSLHLYKKDGTSLGGGLKPDGGYDRGFDQLVKYWNDL